MARPPRPGSPSITPGRAARLYHLLTLTAAAPKPRPVLLKKLKVDLRGFYRDVGFLRGRDIELTCDGDKYQLAGDLDAALDRLPFPDPGLSLRDALQLAEGRTAAHRKLKARLTSFIGPNGHRTP
jgi:hypothetical protein